MAKVTSYNFSWIHKLLIFTLILVFLGVLFRIFTPDEYPVQPLMMQNYNQSATQAWQGVVFTGDPISIDNRLPTANGQVETIENAVLAQSIAQKLSLRQSPEYEYSYLGDTYNLSIIPDPGGYLILYRETSSNQAMGQINAQAALNAAQNFLREYLPDHNLEVVVNETQYLSADDSHLSITTSDEASIISFTFSNQLQSIPILVDKIIDRPVTILVNSQNEIIRMQIRPQYISLSPRRSFETISVYQAVENINNGYASVIFAESTLGYTSSLNFITSANLSSATLEYRLDETTGTIAPYYRFSGELTNDQNQTFAAEIITPAIVTDFSQQIE